MPTETVDDLLEQLQQLKIQENQILTELYQARAREKREQEGSQDEGPQYKNGDQVCITNNIKTFFPRRANMGDRNATVLHMQSQDGVNKKIIQTDNGFKTW
jgi:hypothetical protein